MSYLGKSIIFFLALAGAQAASNPMSDSSYLRKLALHLKGVTPDRQDYLGLERAKSERKVEQYLDQMIERFLGSMGHVHKMDYRLSELFWLAPTPFPGIDSLDGNRNEKHTLFHHYNSLNALFRRIVSEDQSWDKLLLAKEYEIFGPGTFFMDPYPEYFHSDFGHFGALMPDKIPPVARGLVRKRFSQNEYFKKRAGLERIELKFDRNDLRMAGALTTNRFMQRYTTSNASKNRRRAQAIYRIFLCDTMGTSTVEQSKDEKDLFEMYFADRASLDGGKSHFSKVKLERKDPHGQDKACLSCHQKLDPMGRVYMTSSLILSPVPSAGALVLLDSNGKREEIPVNGIGELADAIVQRKEYLECQVTHFWRWFIGEDVPLSAVKMGELVHKFEEVGRRPNRFIKYLVKRPEFRSLKGAGGLQVLALKAKRILNNCNSCHIQANKDFMDYNDLFEPRPLPNISSILATVSTYLDLDNDGRNTRMPPPWSKERLSPDEIQVLKLWISAGAPNVEGKLQLSPGEPLENGVKQ